MRCLSTIILIIVISFPVSIHADDLYKIVLKSSSDAAMLAGLDLVPISQISDGFLVLAGPQLLDEFAELSVEYLLVARDVSPEEIAIDNRLDRANVGKYDLLFEQDNFRLFRISSIVLRSEETEGDVIPFRDQDISFDIRSNEPIHWDAIQAGLDLNTLIADVSQDSLYSYVNRLQAFNDRVTGSDSNYASIDWTKAKFQEFGYDSVLTDEFYTSIYSQNTLVKNVVAYKVGTTFPDRHILITGHRDAVPTSPGADDNGSGTAGVLEIARILKDVPTMATYIFIVCDGEEQGLHGSYNYADNAYSRGDSILYVFNMDMIGHYQNTSEANLYHGMQTTYSELWQQLADSLVGLTGYLAGTSSGSDHYPFQQYGYEVTFLAERIFSTVYHSPQDSTTNMNFEYMTKMVKAALATVYSAGIDATAPALSFEFPEDLPRYISPLSDTICHVEINALNEGVIIDGSVIQHILVNEKFLQSTPMTEISPGIYELMLPSVNCDDNLEFFITAEEEEMGQFYYPAENQTISFKIASEISISLADNFETDLSWSRTISASTGQWHRGVPVDDPGWAYDPSTDGDGSGSCYLTHNTIGNSDVDGGFVTLTSPVFEMNEFSVLEYYYYLNLTNTSGGVDRMLVEISENGMSGPWTEIDRHDNNGGLLWYLNTIEAADLILSGVTLGSNMAAKFTVNDSDPQSIVEAGLDGFIVSYYDCQTGICGDINFDTLGPDITDLTYLVDYMFRSGPPPPMPETADVDGTGEINITDLTLLVDYLFRQGPPLLCWQ